MDFVFLFLAFLLLVHNVWTLYNVPIIIIGIRGFLRAFRRKDETSVSVEDDLPVVSIIVPVKNEEKVVGRLMRALLNLRYPCHKKEIIVVNDESDDKTGEICAQYALQHSEISVFNRPKSTTKAAALNYGLQHSHGEIVATFDADSVPEPDALLKAARYFRDSRVDAVQGQIRSINANENMLTRFLSYEGGVYYEAFTGGKDRLNLFVCLGGTCQFVRRDVFRGLGGWNEKSLSEDMELSLRLAERDCCVRYASDVQTWEESPNTVQSLVKQRSRWFRGNLEMSIKFGRLLKRPNLRRFDAEMTLFGTYLIVMCIVSYFMALWSFALPPSFVLVAVTRVTSLLMVFVLAVAGIALVCVTKPFRLTSLLWLPFVYAYWSFQSLIALYAIFQIVLRRPSKWSKTSRSGAVTSERAKEILTVG